MKFVKCARNSEEQNLVLVQDGDQLFYELCRDILHGEELLVWYGNHYHMFMGIPTGIKTLPKKEKNIGAIQGEIIVSTSSNVTRQFQMLCATSGEDSTRVPVQLQKKERKKERKEEWPMRWVDVFTGIFTFLGGFTHDKMELFFYTLTEKLP